MPLEVAPAVAVRDAVPGDVAALAALSRKTFMDKFGTLYHPEDLASFLETSHGEAVYRQWLADPEIFIRVAEAEDGTLAAYMVCSPLTLPAENAAPGAAELKRLYVDMALQGRGLGTRFVDEALAWARAKGAPEIYLSVYSENFGAQKLYARYGWEKAGEFIFPVGRHEDLEFLMRLPL
ncbi:GNAT family N-acetyltransferase [Hyphomonas sp. WL0036]|uniref:GNAT family N-acetyltransferase n=1 Tax=Hyphomonas sediminis TaxID=2866160 RepID=UPI001C7FC2CB|nr:GNAT family N-acetyltransferase [Hyphomonas sediminis]MBY9067522.1 GNAT family N-acetyltransferase [Hyphomonas sediminis]